MTNAEVKPWRIRVHLPEWHEERWAFRSAREARGLTVDRPAGMYAIRYFDEGPEISFIDQDRATLYCAGIILNEPNFAGRSVDLFNVETGEVVPMRSGALTDAVKAAHAREGQE